MRSLFPETADILFNEIRKILLKKKVKGKILREQCNRVFRVIIKDSWIRFTFEAGIKLRLLSYPPALTPLALHILERVNTKDIVNKSIERIIGRFMPSKKNYMSSYRWNCSTDNLLTYQGKIITQKKNIKSFIIVLRIRHTPVPHITEVYIHQGQGQGKRNAPIKRRITQKMLHNIQEKANEKLWAYYYKNKKQSPTKQELLFF